MKKEATYQKFRPHIKRGLKGHLDDTESHMDRWIAPNYLASQKTMPQVPLRKIICDRVISKLITKSDLTTMDTLHTKKRIIISHSEILYTNLLKTK